MGKTKNTGKASGTSKNKRQFTIRELVTKEHLSSQDDLQRSLKKAGFDVNQATLSRDLAEMGVGRVATAEGPRYTFYEESEDHRVRALLSYEVRGIHNNESMIVIKTLAGRAHGVAEMIDSMESRFILGTIAGDNTIFIAPRAMKDTKRLMHELRAFITSE
ncbi:MAG TPA: arginine repressor [Candidatus Kapabacteria bacterium]|nr:arginine repressor [Candidatus Kapabacteria bacterium]